MPLSELIENIVGGEWGKEEITGNYKNRIRCIRGTDIPNVQKSYYDDIPVRYVSRKHINEKSVKPNDIIYIIQPCVVQSITYFCHFPYWIILVD